jgi:hypothetical protein
MEMVLIKKESKEWEWMWEQVAKHPLNEGLENPSVAYNDGKTWEYIGSYSNIVGLIIHEFRHKKHPSDESKTTYYKFQASQNIIAEDIEKRLPVK